MGQSPLYPVDEERCVILTSCSASIFVLLSHCRQYDIIVSNYSPGNLGYRPQMKIPGAATDVERDEE